MSKDSSEIEQANVIIHQELGSSVYVRIHLLYLKLFLLLSPLILGH